MNRLLRTLMLGLASLALASLGLTVTRLAAAAPAANPLSLPVMPLPKVAWFNALLAQAPIKAVLPIPILAALAPVAWRVFRGTWRSFDWEATLYRVRRSRPVKNAGWAARLSQRDKMVGWVSGAWRTGILGRRKRDDEAALFSSAGNSLHEIDYRPAACFVITAMVLTMQEYYGGRSFYDGSIDPILRALEKSGWAFLKLKKYSELYGYAWWVLARLVGYVGIPVTFWKLIFPKDSLLDMGLRTRGFISHLWIYGVCLAIVLPVLLLVAQQPDFGTYYPFYKNSSRSWFDFLLWESMYWLQFLSLEFFFRGWMLSVLRRTLGAAAIFAMAVPYCMIHYGKPYLEAHGAIVAGVVLGSLAMRTRSIYAGFLLHITVAVGMDLLSLWKRASLPHSFWAAG
ncbi:MAG TPA: CPBP family intramembrane glutamic endopeptidase [Polyangiaceae bacterium]|nr:CPBP family intramembrane glutamic endopeptidase [Polyangiaceae bacterium]